MILYINSVFPTKARMATELARRIRGTRPSLGYKLRQEWLEATDIKCEPLTFGDLKKGDRFIFMPGPGDNSGHGGLLNGSYLFMKIDDNNMNAVKLTDGICFELEDNRFVIIVE